ncbi:MAG: carbohydrate-binding domain-containing protein [Bacteroidetes bacterium]|nr:carbohydrate-binding domain-containing protein [Bacteroidota bacterium]MBS1931295.1 carbohydrate-binding domain-containing protein [Bacteroidota bacterium]
MKKSLNLSPLSTLFICVSIFYLSACSKSDLVESITPSTIDSSFTNGTAEGSTETGYDEDDLVETSFTLSNTVTITYGSSVSVNNPLDGNGVTITLDGNNVVVNASVVGVAYEVSGSTANGSLKIYSDKKYKLVLNGASIKSTDRPALNIQSKKTTFVVVADNSENTLADAATYTSVTSGEDAKAAFFSEGQIVFSGSGSLTVTGNYNHAIASDDYIHIRSGKLNLTSNVKDAIHANDAFIMDNGTVTLTSADDGVQVDAGHAIVNNGTLNITSVGKGITADNEDEDSTVTPYVVINGGTINVTSSANEGIESKGDLTINSGNIVTKTTDDGINATDNIYINGGRIYSYATDNDAIDANGTITITGGIIVAAGAREPEASFDCDTRTFKITGGMMVGVAGATSAPSASASTIHSLVAGSGTSGQIIHIEDSNGNEVMTFKAPESFSTLIYASSKLKASTTYKIYTGGSVSSGTDFNGLYLSGSYSGGTISTTFSTTSVVTQIGGSISRG